MQGSMLLTYLYTSPVLKIASAFLVRERFLTAKVHTVA